MATDAEKLADLIAWVTEIDEELEEVKRSIARVLEMIGKDTAQSEKRARKNRP